MVKQEKKDVVFFEAFDEEVRLLKELCPGHISAEFLSKTIQESKLRAAPCALISIRTQSRIPEEWSSSLAGILTRSTGFEHVLDYKKKTHASLALGYLPSYCARAVAEQAFLLILGLLRKVKKQQENFASFCRDGLTGGECQDKKILVVGVGHIGAEIVDIARGFHMKVAGIDIDQKLPSLEYTDLVSGLAWADIVVCACSLTPETKGMLGYEALRRVKTGALFVNIARGEVSPAKDLKRLLDENILGGVGLDVFDDEDVIAHALRAKNDTLDEKIAVVLELNRRSNVLLTPHNAFNTQEALMRKAQQTIESVVSFLAVKKFSYAIPEKENE